MNNQPDKERPDPWRQMVAHGEDGRFKPGDERRELTELQSNFVSNFVENGGDSYRAALSAGYTPASARTVASLNMRLPWVLKGIERERGRLLAELDVKSLAVLRGVLEDCQAAIQHRLKAAEIVQKVRGAELAGRDKAKDDKDLSAMTIAELESYIRAREEALQRVGEVPAMVGSAQGSEQQST